MPDKVPPGPSPEDAIEDIFGGDEEEPQKKQGDKGDSLQDAKDRFDEIRDRLKGDKEGEKEGEAPGKPAGEGEGKEGLPEEGEAPEGAAPEGAGAGVSEGAPKGAGATEGGAASIPGAEAAEAAGAGVGEAGTETGAGGAETAGIVGAAGVAGAEAAEAPAAETAAGAASAAGAAGAATGAAAEAGTTGAAGAAGTAAGAETGPAAPIIGGAVAAGVAAAGAASEVGEKVGISKKAQIFLCCTCCIVFLAGPLLMGIAGFMLLANRNNKQSTPPAVGGLLTPPNLGAPDANGYYTLPQDPKGRYVLYGNCHKGTLTLIQVLYTVGIRWYEKHPRGPKVAIGDLNAPGHVTHHNGINADVVFDDGSININNSNYNAANTTELALMFFETKKMEHILYNGDAVRTIVNAAVQKNGWPGHMSPWPNHDDHFHIQLNVKKGPDSWDCN